MDTTQSPLAPSPVYNRMLDGINEAELAMRKAAEENAAAYKDALLKIVEGVAAGFLEQHRDARNWSGAEWGAGQVSKVVQTARHCIYEQMKDVRAQQLERDRDEARGQVMALRQEVATLREQTTILQGIIRQRQGSVDQPSQPVQPAQAGSPAQPVESAPPLMPVPRPELPYGLQLKVPGVPKWWEYNGSETERDRDYVKKALFLGLLGETGYSSRKWIERVVSPLIAADGSGRSGCQRLIKKLDSLGWIEIVDTDKRDIWLPHAIQLTEAGREMFRRIFEVKPVESEFSQIMRHHGEQSRYHALLCVGAADQFRQRGAAVACMPEPVQLEGKCSFQPDLSVTVQVSEGVEETWLVECERGAGPPGLSADRRVAKWQNSLLIQGAVYLVAPESQARSELVKEILKIGRYHGRIYATDMVTLQQKSDEFWAEVREF
ncbi:MAG: hypothetical protein JW850_12915 [Thermoflexales bacterium]|nr:hypothetical protein [Thermoflexales bacterium]